MIGEEDLAEGISRLPRSSGGGQSISFSLAARPRSARACSVLLAGIGLVVAPDQLRTADVPAPPDIPQRTQPRQTTNGSYDPIADADGDALRRAWLETGRPTSAPDPRAAGASSPRWGKSFDLAWQQCFVSPSSYSHDRAQRHDWYAVLAQTSYRALWEAAYLRKPLPADMGALHDLIEEPDDPWEGHGRAASASGLEAAVRRATVAA